MAVFHAGMMLGDGEQAAGICNENITFSRLAVSIHQGSSSSAAPAVTRLCPGGWGSCLAVLEDASLASFNNSNDDSKCEESLRGQPAVGLPFSRGLVPYPHLRVRTAAQGWDHIVVCTEDGRVWGGASWNSSGVLRGNSGSHVERLQPVDGMSSVTVAEVAAGERHCLALSQSGDVWAWGRNTDGQVGIGGTCYEAPPSLILGPGLSALTTAGLPPDKQADKAPGPPEAAAEPEPDADAAQPSLPPTAFEVAVGIAAGSRHSVAVNARGAVLCWGSNKHGQCGCPPGMDVERPTEVRSLGGLVCVDVAAGLGHTVACTDIGDAYCWGWNSDGQLGMASEGIGHIVQQPMLVEGPGIEEASICQVSCGSRHTAALTESGSVYTWGANDFGQLGGSGGAESVTGQPDGPADRASALGLVREIACGEWHTLVALAEDAAEAGT